MTAGDVVVICRAPTGCVFDHRQLVHGNGVPGELTARWLMPLLLRVQGVASSVLRSRTDGGARRARERGIYHHAQAAVVQTNRRFAKVSSVSTTAPARQRWRFAPWEASAIYSILPRAYIHVTFAFVVWRRRRMKKKKKKTTLVAVQIRRDAFCCCALLLAAAGGDHDIDARERYFMALIAN